MQQLLQRHKLDCASHATTGDPVELIIRRSKLLPTAFHAIKERSFDCCRDILIKFSGEEGADSGGSRREFFRYENTYM